MENKQKSVSAETKESEEIQRYSTNTIWEPIVGYSRAVRTGRMIFVSGTTAVGKDGNVVCPGDAYGQACRCFEIVKETLHALNAKMDHVVRTRMYVTDVSNWEDIGKAHKEYFGAHPPASTMVGVQLVNGEMLVEVEVEAYVDGE